MIRKNSLSVSLLIAAVILLTMGSCNPKEDFELQENLIIQNYLTENPTLDFAQQSSGLYYFVIQEGTGTPPVAHDTAYVKYTGKFLNGTVFDTNIGESRTDTLKVPVDEGWMIEGFDEALTLMKLGEKAMFLIPSKLAYGPSGYYIINGYTPLLFDVELVRIKRGPVK
jgi:FKBP-type peptidyl-prolyl cis-trans isomerase